MNPESRHQAVNELLPWHATQALSLDERLMVEEHLKDCQQCREELAFLRKVGGATKEYATEIPPVPDMLPKTLAAIDKWEEARAPVRPGWLARLLDQFWNPPIPLARAVLAVQLALIIGLTSPLIFTRSVEPSFSTLSGVGVSTSGARLTVIFRPDTTEEAMRRAVLDLNGSIVSGPSALGVYIVELPLEDSDTEEIDTAIEQLRNDSTVVDFVERQP